MRARTKTTYIYTEHARERHLLRCKLYSMHAPLIIIETLGCLPTLQERLQELIHPSPEEYRRGATDDRRRLRLSLSQLCAGADRVRCLYCVPRPEITAGEGPATTMLESLRSLPEKADDVEQRNRALRAARGDTFEVMH